MKTYGYSSSSPLVDITAGDNWFYKGIRGYEPGAGLGTQCRKSGAGLASRQPSLIGVRAMNFRQWVSFEKP